MDYLYEDYVYKIKEVRCRNCGCFFEVETESPELPSLFGECFECGDEGEHPVVDEDW